MAQEIRASQPRRSLFDTVKFGTGKRFDAGSLEVGKMESLGDSVSALVLSSSEKKDIAAHRHWFEAARCYRMVVMEVSAHEAEKVMKIVRNVTATVSGIRVATEGNSWDVSNQELCRLFSITPFNPKEDLAPIVEPEVYSIEMCAKMLGLPAKKHKDRRNEKKMLVNLEDVSEPGFRTYLKHFSRRVMMLSGCKRLSLARLTLADRVQKKLLHPLRVWKAGIATGCDGSIFFPSAAAYSLAWVVINTPVIHLEGLSMTCKTPLSRRPAADDTLSTGHKRMRMAPEMVVDSTAALCLSGSRMEALLAAVRTEEEAELSLSMSVGCEPKTPLGRAAFPGTYVSAANDYELCRLRELCGQKLLELETLKAEDARKEQSIYSLMASHEAEVRNLKEVIRTYEAKEEEATLVAKHVEADLKSDEQAAGTMGSRDMLQDLCEHEQTNKASHAIPVLNGEADELLRPPAEANSLMSMRFPRGNWKEVDVGLEANIESLNSTLRGLTTENGLLRKCLENTRAECVKTWLKFSQRISFGMMNTLEVDEMLTGMVFVAIAALSGIDPAAILPEDLDTLCPHIPQRARFMMPQFGKLSVAHFVNEEDLHFRLGGKANCRAASLLLSVMHQSGADALPQGLAWPDDVCEDLPPRQAQRQWSFAVERCIFSNIAVVFSRWAHAEERMDMRQFSLPRLISFLVQGGWMEEKFDPTANALRAVDDVWLSFVEVPLMRPMSEDATLPFLMTGRDPFVISDLGGGRRRDSYPFDVSDFRPCQLQMSSWWCKSTPSPKVMRWLEDTIDTGPVGEYLGSIAHWEAGFNGFDPNSPPSRSCFSKWKASSVHPISSLYDPLPRDHGTIDRANLGVWLHSIHSSAETMKCLQDARNFKYYCAIRCLQTAMDAAGVLFLDGTVHLHKFTIFKWFSDMGPEMARVFNWMERGGYLYIVR